MLTEDQIDKFIDYFKGITYTYDGWDINPTIVRYGEGFDRKNPFITFNFIPTSRLKFRSISDVIGYATEKGEYKDYGCCQIEDVEIRCYANKEHYNRTIHGKSVAFAMAVEIQRSILREVANEILPTFNACMEYDAPPIPTDVSLYDPRKGTKMYIFEIDFKIRTQYRWNLIPIDYPGSDVICEDIEVLKINDHII